jgi:hypothetical protein
LVRALDSSGDLLRRRGCDAAESAAVDRRTGFQITGGKQLRRQAQPAENVHDFGSGVELLHALSPYARPGLDPGPISLPQKSKADAGSSPA